MLSKLSQGYLECPEILKAVEAAARRGRFKPNFLGLEEKQPEGTNSYCIKTGRYCAAELDITEIGRCPDGTCFSVFDITMIRYFHSGGVGDSYAVLKYDEENDGEDYDLFESEIECVYHGLSGDDV